jgi:CARDB
MRRTCIPSRLLVLVTLLTPVTALAARPQPNGAHLDQTETQTVHVAASSGEFYDSLAGSQSQMKTMLYGRCSNGRQLLAAWVKAKNAQYKATVFQNDVIETSGTVDPNGKEIKPTTVFVPDGIHPSFSFPNVWKQKVVEACNSNLIKQVNQNGLTKAAALAKEWHLNNVAIDTLEATLSCDHEPTGTGFDSHGNDNYTTQIPAKVNVVCDKVAKPEPPPQRTTPDPGIHLMKLWFNPSESANYVGFCPKKLHVGGEMSYQLPPTGRDKDVRYRYVLERGVHTIKSPIYTTTFTESGKKYLHTWPVDFPLGNPGGDLVAPTAHDKPDVFAGTVVLEFVNNVPIHSNLKALPFKVTCIKEGKVSAAVGGNGQLASEQRPIDRFPTGGQSPQAMPAFPAMPGAPVMPAMPAKPSPAVIAATPAQSTNPVATGTAFVAKFADLIIRTVQAVPGNDRNLRVLVKNIGTADAGPTNLKTFYHRSGQVVVRGTTVGAIPAGGEAWVIANVNDYPFSSASAVTMRVDDPNRIAESNEGNNDYKYK